MKSLIRSILLPAVVLLTGAVNGANAQILINEIEMDPPNATVDACQYVEIKGPSPGAVIPAGTYFASVNSDLNNFGFANVIRNIGGLTFGSNGTLTLVNTFSGACSGRTYNAGTNLVGYSSPLWVGGGANAPGSETYIIFQSSQNLISGTDLDTDDDGQFDANRGITAVLDGFALLVNPKEEFIYGASAGVVNISNTTAIDQPDAVTRFPGNNTPFAAAAFYFGEVAASPDETTSYADPRSPNFPTGGELTPGGVNSPAAPGNANARLDYDGDGRTDLAVFRNAEPSWHISRSTAGYLKVVFGLSGDIPVPGDFDGDGKEDNAVFRPSDAAGVADFYIFNSSSFTVSFYEWGSIGDEPLSGDYDGDGKTDITVYRNSAALWFVLQSGNGTLRQVEFGLPGDKPMVVEPDGDGKDNFAVFRPGENRWYIARPTGNPATNFDAPPFGLAGDILVPGDYDGDSKDDLAVFRPSGGQWIIQQSTDSAVKWINFGLSTDVPVPGDYDGDGKDDLAVFRAGTWYVLRSTSGLQIVPFGSGTDDPVGARLTY